MHVDAERLSDGGASVELAAVAVEVPPSQPTPCPQPGERGSRTCSRGGLRRGTSTLSRCGGSSTTLNSVGEASTDTLTIDSPTEEPERSTTNSRWAMRRSRNSAATRRCSTDSEVAARDFSGRGASRRGSTRPRVPDRMKKLLDDFRDRRDRQMQHRSCKRFLSFTSITRDLEALPAVSEPTTPTHRSRKEKKGSAKKGGATSAAASRDRLKAPQTPSSRETPLSAQPSVEGAGGRPKISP